MRRLILGRAYRGPTRKRHGTPTRERNRMTIRRILLAITFLGVAPIWQGRPT